MRDEKQCYAFLQKKRCLIFKSTLDINSYLIVGNEIIC
jgi:hypothetical protein